MKLYFLRHAEAEDGPVDEKRKLTQKGRRDSRKLGRYLRDLDVQFDRSFTSPLVRAVETAECVLKACGSRRRGALKEVRELTNATSEAAFLRWLKKLPNCESVLLVGHEPSISGHVRALLGLESMDALPLAKGAIARVDTEDRRHGSLRMLLGPKQLS